MFIRLHDSLVRLGLGVGRCSAGPLAVLVRVRDLLKYNSIQTSQLKQVDVKKRGRNKIPQLALSATRRQGGNDTVKKNNLL